MCTISLSHYSRAANSHALTVRLAHFTTFSHSHGDIFKKKIYNFFCLSEVCDVRRVPLLCACKIEAKILRSEKKKCFYNFFNFYNFFCLSEVCDVRRVPLLCACKIEAKILRSEKKKCWSPPPPPDFIGWQQTAPRISHSKLSSNVGSPAIVYCFFNLRNCK